METSGVVNIDYLIATLKNRMQEYNAKRYKTYEALFSDAIRYLDIFTTKPISVAYLQMNEANYVTLPNDYVEYTKIGVKYCGNVWTLTKNDNILIPRDEECGLPISEVATGKCGCVGGLNGVPSGYLPFYPHYNNFGIWIPKLYGIGGGFTKNQFRIDEQNRMLIISGIPPTEIVLEYKSTGVTNTSKTVIPIKYTDALIYFVIWKLAEFGKINYNVDRAKQNYLEEECVVKNLDWQMTISEELDTLYQTYRLSPKR